MKRFREHRFLRSNGKPAFSSRIYQIESELEDVMNRNVITITKTRSIKDCMDIMVENGLRRIPVADAENRLSGIVTATDIINYFGGGEYYKIIVNKHKENIYSAFNELISSIMTKGVIKAYYYDKITNILEKMIKFNIGGLPVVLEDERIVGIITEADVLKQITGNVPEIKVKEAMNENVITATPNLSLIDIMKIIVNEGVRRLPLVIKNKPIGMVSAMDIVRYLSSSEPFRRAIGGSIRPCLEVKITDVSSPQVISVNENMYLEDALDIMFKKDVGGLIVTDDKGQLKGIITERDILISAIIEKEVS